MAIFVTRLKQKCHCIHLFCIQVHAITIGARTLVVSVSGLFARKKMINPLLPSLLVGPKFA